MIFLKLTLGCFLLFLAAAAGGLAVRARAQNSETPRRLLRIAVLDFADAGTGLRAADALALALGREGRFRLTDRAESRAAARGIGYAGSLNMSTAEARDLGAAIGCDFFITGDAGTLRRSASARPVYYEAYASLFIVSATTGRLVRWQRISHEAATPDEAEKHLLENLQSPDLVIDYSGAMTRARADERGRRALAPPPPQQRERASLVFEDEPEEGSPAAHNYRPPQPFRRLRPIYTDEAARSEVEATVDASVEIDADGAVREVEIVRWAGFGLDDAVTSTIGQLHFRPAMRDGTPFPVRVLLRYNFRRPPKSR